MYNYSILTISLIIKSIVLYRIKVWSAGTPYLSIRRAGRGGDWEERGGRAGLSLITDDDRHSPIFIIDSLSANGNGKEQTDNFNDTIRRRYLVNTWTYVQTSSSHWCFRAQLHQCWQHAAAKRAGGNREPPSFPITLQVNPAAWTTGFQSKLFSFLSTYLRLAKHAP